jgi:hypothetical protein
MENLTSCDANIPSVAATEDISGREPVHKKRKVLVDASSSSCPGLRRKNSVSIPAAAARRPREPLQPVVVERAQQEPAGTAFSSGADSGGSNEVGIETINLSPGTTVAEDKENKPGLFCDFLRAFFMDLRSAPQTIDGRLPLGSVGSPGADAAGEDMFLTMGQLQGADRALFDPLSAALNISTVELFQHFNHMAVELPCPTAKEFQAGGGSSSQSGPLREESSCVARVSGAATRSETNKVVLWKTFRDFFLQNSSGKGATPADGNQNISGALTDASFAVDVFLDESTGFPFDLRHPDPMALCQIKFPREANDEAALTSFSKGQARVVRVVEQGSLEELRNYQQQQREKRRLAKQELLNKQGETATAGTPSQVVIGAPRNRFEISVHPLIRQRNAPFESRDRFFTPASGTVPVRTKPFQKGVGSANLKAAASTSATDAASGVNKITKWFEPKEKECPESEDNVKPKEQVEAQKKIQEGDASLYLSLFEYCENENMKEEACP